MKKLSTRAGLWMLLVALIVFLNTFLGFNALHELRKTDEAIVQDYQVALRSRELREAFFLFHNEGLTAALSRKRSDVRKRDEQRDILLRDLDRGLGQGVDSNIQEEFESLRTKIKSTVARLPGDGQLGVPGQSTFLNPGYRRLYEALTLEITALAEHSARSVAQEQEGDTAFYYSSLRINLLILIFSVLLFILGTAFFYRRVLVPFSAVTQMAERIRNGDPDVAYEENGSDEVTRMGESLNSMASELRARREERVRFVGAIAHDIKNPLTAIRLKCDLGLGAGAMGSPETLSRLFETIRSQVDRARRIADDLLQVASSGLPVWRLDMKVIDLNQVILETVRLFRASHPATAFTMDESGQPLLFQGDRDRIEQILINIISNALKYSPAGSRVEIQAGMSGAEAVFFEVRDQGIGIPDSLKEKIFEPFSRVHGKRSEAEGTGLGLSIVKDLVGSHGGTVVVSDRPGGGTIFRVVIPMRSMTEGRNVA